MNKQQELNEARREAEELIEDAFPGLLMPDYTTFHGDPEEWSKVWRKPAGPDSVAGVFDPKKE